MSKKSEDDTQTPTSIHVLLLSGRSGVGKTSVANELAAQLRNHGLPHVHIDGDNLDGIFPEAHGTEFLLPNLEGMWRTYYSLRRSTRLILSGTAVVLEQDAIKQTIERASRGIRPGSDVYVDVVGVILTASDSTAVARLEEREIGSTLDQHVQSSVKMSQMLGELVDKSVQRVPTDNRSVVDIAVDILESANWISRSRN